MKTVFSRDGFLMNLVCQVYIVAVERSRREETANPSSSESGAADLLKLVQSDLSTLSRLWLAVLQDYALLTLPQEYSSQLPAAGTNFLTGRLHWYNI